MLEEIARLPGCSAAVFNFGGSGALAQQIENGAPADAFFSASPAQMDALETRGLLAPGTRKALLGNELVLIASKASAQLRGFSDLARTDVKTIAIGEPKSVPVGTYAQEVFDHLNLADAVKPKLVFLLDARQVLAAVERGDADAALVYESDALGSRSARVAARAPAGSHSPIIYFAAVVKNSAHGAAAESFIARLFSPEAAEIFRRGGFVVASAAPGSATSLP